MAIISKLTKRRTNKIYFINAENIVINFVIYFYMDKMILVETDKITDKIQKILRQTNYTQTIALEKLKEFGYDEISVIKDYIGILNKNETTDKITSINQSIYKQLRTHLDGAMKDYHKRVDRGDARPI